MDTRLLTRLALAFALVLFGVSVAHAQTLAPLPVWQSSTWHRGGATLDLDFVHDKYWLNGTSYSGVSNFVSGAGATFTRAGANATYFDATGTLQTAAANTARLDHSPTSPYAPLGVLIEESRTNSIHNNTMAGAAAGTPGTLPTTWGLGNLGTLSSSVVGTGTENGISYIDLRVWGTTSTPYVVFYTDALKTAAASNSQFWSAASYIKLSAGSLSNITGCRLTISDRDSSAIQLNATQTGYFTPTNAALNTQGRSLTAQMTDASTAYVSAAPIVYFTDATGDVVDFTLRIGMPQLELGAYPTSAIPTSGSTVTRAGDVFTVPTTAAGANGAWFTAGIGTLGTVGTVAFSDAVSNTSLNHFFASIDDGTQNNNISTFISRNNAGSGNFRKAQLEAGGSITYIPSLSGYTWGTSAKEIIAFQANDQGSALDGTLYADGTAATIPTVTKLQVGGIGGGVSLDGWLTRIWYMPTRQADAALAGFTQ